MKLKITPRNLIQTCHRKIFLTLSEIRKRTNKNEIGCFSLFKNIKLTHKDKIDIQATFQKSPNTI